MFLSMKIIYDMIISIMSKMCPLKFHLVVMGLLQMYTSK
jgi:hypothetical protein